VGQLSPPGRGPLRFAVGRRRQYRQVVFGALIRTRCTWIVTVIVVVTARVVVTAGVVTASIVGAGGGGLVVFWCGLGRG